MNIPEYNGSTLYHYIKIEYLFNILQKRQFILRRVDTWMDKFECPIDALRFKVAREIDIESLNYRKVIYGASFTPTKESDAMWRLYSPDAKSVCLKLDVNELKKALHALDDIINSKSSYHGMCRWLLPPRVKQAYQYAKKEYEKYEPNAKIEEDRASYPTYIAKVKYVSNRLIEKRIDKLKELDKGTYQIPFEDALVEMYHKRRAYQHENEVRIIAYWEWQSLLEDMESLPFHVTPEKLIKSVILDPRLGSEESQMIKSYLVNKYNLPCRSISQSRLYQQPKSREVNFL